MGERVPLVSCSSPAHFLPTPPSDAFITRSPSLAHACLCAVSLRHCHLVHSQRLWILRLQTVRAIRSFCERAERG
ncbi:unnamed protein product [Victoria cruziana]